MSLFIFFSIRFEKCFFFEELYLSIKNNHFYHTKKYLVFFILSLFSFYFYFFLTILFVCVLYLGKHIKKNKITTSMSFAESHKKRHGKKISKPKILKLKKSVLNEDPLYFPPRTKDFDEFNAWKMNMPIPKNVFLRSRQETYSTCTRLISMAFYLNSKNQQIAYQFTIDRRLFNEKSPITPKISRMATAIDRLIRKPIFLTMIKRTDPISTSRTNKPFGYSYESAIRRHMMDIDIQVRDK